MTDTRLYIDGKRADLDSDSLITLSFALDDTANPTIVKNSFSKSITLPSTKNNDAIFGNMRDLQSRVLPSVSFSPLVRTPFKLYIDGELVESGYVQLTEVTRKKGVCSYKINLFGGLGDFFYALTYDEDGNKRTLADLNFGIEGAVDAETEMDFEITKEAVDLSWNSLGGGRHSLSEVITFVPAYNGIGDSFDAEHALVNTNGLKASVPSSLTDNGKTYMPYNGYGLAEFPKSLTEWEVGDLRSYMQRPALSVRALMYAISNPANNGGYEVELDDNFFHDYNALYKDAYITLPMLVGESGDGVSSEASIQMPNVVCEQYIESMKVHQLASESASSSVTINVPITLSIMPSVADVDTLYDSTTFFDNTNDPDTGDYVGNVIVRTGMLVKVAVYEKSTKITESRSMVFSSYPEDLSSSATPVQGSYKKKGSQYIFTDENGNNTFPLEVSFFKRTYTNIRIVVTAQRIYHQGANTQPNFYFPNVTYIGGNADYENAAQKYASYTYLSFDATTIKQVREGLPGISSGSKITKQMLLTTNATPADYLLSYTKLFGLRFLRDKYAKKITITSNYFTGEVIDLRSRIDYSGDVKITPSAFSKRIMRMALNTPDTYYSKKYKDAHGIDYAQKRVDTGFSFNADVEDVYKDNVYTQAVPCRAVSQLFYRYANASGESVPSPFALTLTYSLSIGSPSASAEKFDMFGKELQSNNVVEQASATPYFAIKGYDALPKMCYFTQQEGAQESVDIANNLVVFSGRMSAKDANGNVIKYYLTDDLPEMIKFNGKVCYLMTQSVESVGAEKIAIERTTIPQFLNIRLINGVVYDSFDMAKSKEHYLGGNIDYPEQVTLYSRYWNRYYAERLDVNTRMVECMVDFSGITIDVDSNRHYYFFEDAYWLLNSVSDYNPSSSALTKCQFIKVRTPHNVQLSTGTSDAFTYSLPMTLRD